MQRRARHIFLPAGLLMLAAGITVAGRTQNAAAPVRPAAPELVGASWLNTPNNKPVTLASRRGKVTIVHFWTFG